MTETVVTNGVASGLPNGAKKLLPANERLHFCTDHYWNFIAITFSAYTI